MWRGTFFFIFLLLLKTGHSQSSNLIFKHINRASGLPVDEVSCIAQDSTGFVWIGSKEGLFRYDGFSYKSFFSEPGTGFLPGNLIFKIYVDTEGLLWIGTNNGLVLMKNNGEILHQWNEKNNLLFSSEAKSIVDIRQDGAVVWITTGDGLYSAKKSGNLVSIRRYDFKKDFHYSSNQLGSFVIDSKGRLWICTMSGLVIFNAEKRTLIHSGNNPDLLTIFNEKAIFRSLYLDEVSGQLRYTTWEPAEKKFDLMQNKVSVVYAGKAAANPDFSFLINQFLKDNHGTLWMASGSGLKLAKAGSNDEEFIKHFKGNIYGLPTNTITCLMQDKEGALWVGTSMGLSVVQPYKQPLVNISTHNEHNFPFAGYEVTDVIPADDSTYLVGTAGGGGLFRTDAAFNVLQHYSFGSMDYDWIWNFTRWGDSIFIATQKGNLIYDCKTKTVARLLSQPFDKFFPVFSSVPGKDGSLWMSRYWNDFIQYKPGLGTYKKYGLKELGELETVLKLASDSDQNIWLLSSLGGVLKFNPVTETIIERFPVGKNGLAGTHILFLLDVGEELLIGYVADGITLYNKKTKTFRHFNRSHGLISNSVTDAVQTNQNTVWITTSNGISKLNLEEKDFINYDYHNGILQNDFGNIVLLPDGRLAAGNKKGLVYFHPDHISTLPKVEPPFITSFMVHGKDFPIDSIGKAPVKIAFDQNYFSVEYLSLQFQDYQQIEYAYILQGFDKDWVIAGNRRYVAYANLDGGHYKLRIKARQPGGQWVESKMQLSINVSTILYKRWWFVPLSLLIFTALVFALFRYRVYQLLKLEKLRQSISSDLHDEVGASLSSISIFSEMAKQSLHTGDKAGDYLQRIGDRSRESIQKMSDIIWSINPENDSLQQLLIRMRTFANEITDGRDIRIQWTQSEIPAGITLGMLQRKNFYLLYKEAVINALKYSSAKNIIIDLAIRNKSISLEIRDDGKGFDTNKITPGNGLKNIRQRARLLKGITAIISSPGQGTTVQVSFRY